MTHSTSSWWSVVRASLAAAALGCAPKQPRPIEPTVPAPEKYGVGLLHIAASYAAKEGCSCVFVTGRSVEACESYLRVSPDVAKIKVDIEARVVRAKALGFTAEARHVDDREGCQLAPLR